MHRRELKALLAAYRVRWPQESATVARFDAFVDSHPDCFHRSCRVGHVTGSAWIVDMAGDRVLLAHHRKLGRWLQPGGHSDGDPDTRHTGLRTGAEETGIRRSLALCAAPAAASRGPSAHRHRCAGDARSHQNSRKPVQEQRRQGAGVDRSAFPTGRREIRDRGATRLGRERPPPNPARKGAEKPHIRQGRSAETRVRAAAPGADHCGIVVALHRGREPRRGRIGRLAGGGHAERAD